MVVRLIYLFLFVLSFNAQALDLPTLQARLQAQQNFSAQLVQSKTLKGWNKPLQAHGLLACTKKSGVLYYLQRPIKASYWLQSNQVSVREGTADVRVITTTQMPWLAGISSLLSASVSGDWERLQQQFSVQLINADDNAWQIELTPISAPLNTALQSVHVSGGARIENILINDKKGDRTDIQLQQHQMLDDAQFTTLIREAGQQ